jgi:hypothetical protein
MWFIFEIYNIYLFFFVINRGEISTFSTSYTILRRVSDHLCLTDGCQVSDNIMPLHMISFVVLTAKTGKETAMERDTLTNLFRHSGSQSKTALLLLSFVFSATPLIISVLLILTPLINAKLPRNLGRRRVSTSRLRLIHNILPNGSNTT